ncbi:universal stress protein [Streptomyces sp.]|uniref:universal stress protein n=1 Tax=Streptomyces sp. TaxID=1931 RepID=UPI002D788BF8|nr:universal stress protein [Streptomyces sp.]HET6358087.1 universal stress protein [Streptomyces sp.]
MTPPRTLSPVVVVPASEHITQQPPYFVVGVDGSPQSAPAVDFAFEEAALRGAVLAPRRVARSSPSRTRTTSSPQSGRRLLTRTRNGNHVPARVRRRQQDADRRMVRALPGAK